MKIPTYFKNKYVIAISFFIIYALFLDDVDIFTIIRQNSKLRELESEKRVINMQLEETQLSLKKLQTISGIEKYAREKKLFKKDNEDIFVISYE